MGAASTAVGGLFGAYGDTKQRKEAKKARRYQRKRSEQASAVGQQQLADLFGTPGTTRTVLTPTRGAGGMSISGPQGAGYRSGVSQRLGAGGGFEATTVTTPGTEGSVGRLFDEAGNLLSTGAEQAIETLSPYAEQGTAAFDMYTKALMGGEGADEAFGAFRESTGFDFLRDEALQATSRQFGARGMGQSGNVLTALQDRATGLAQQSYTDWLGALMGAGQVGQQQTTNIANIQQGLGANLAGLATGQAQLETDFRKALMGGEYGVSTSAMAGLPGLQTFSAQAQAAPWHTIGSSMAASGNQAWNEFMQIAPMMMGKPNTQLKTNGEK